MPLQQTSGNATQDAFGGGVAVVPNYIEEVFSTWLYDGTGSTQTITNNIDISTQGGLVWIKQRNGSFGHYLTYPGLDNGSQQGYISSEATDPASYNSTGLTAFNTNGFTVNSNSQTNGASKTYTSWTFREKTKFFDIVTYTGTGSARTVAHNLGSVPGCIIVKALDQSSAWRVYHRSIGNTGALALNLTAATSTSTTYWNDTSPTSTNFTVESNSATNAASTIYVAYLFAHDAGGFGLTGTDNVISCGSFTSDIDGNASVNLGYEPQFWLFKPTIAARQWTIYDTMRGWSQTYIAGLVPNTAAAESSGSATLFYPTATGFDCVGGGLDASTQHIYIAIRRGPMKVPTDATKVFDPLSRAGTGANATITTSLSPVDMVLETPRSPTIGTGPNIFDRLRGANAILITSSTASEGAPANVLTGFGVQTGYTVGPDSGGYGINTSGYTFINWNFRRAPGFFDEVCFTGNNSYGYKNHNLTVVPELIISKRRGTAQDWLVWQPSSTYVGYLNLTDAFFNNGSSPATATQFTPILDQSSATYVVYLFATCAGVSKVGTYTGNGTTQTINCGFTGGARFVLIKRTDSTGAWYTYDTARGMTTLTDPYLLMNSTAAEVATLGSVTTVSTGFALNSTILAAINVSGGTYIYLSIA